ncbi:hypothetical protein PAHAL_2G108200 [Panicum hallii]|uniref:Uncharacterized protein n=1 Tax=Panicum hallii TaxID=206008 RepID=A0A2T8KNM4_9POAL|nr:hypothetical protein PAHAL_2G108200 [Panicum hallii]
MRLLADKLMISCKSITTQQSLQHTTSRLYMSEWVLLWRLNLLCIQQRPSKHNLSPKFRRSNTHNHHRNSRNPQ